MIPFRCQCGNNIQAPDEYAGKQAKCAKCKHTITVPSKWLPANATAQPGLPAHPTQPSRQVVEEPESPTGLSAEKKIVIGVAIGVAVIILAFTAWFFLIRDTWELDHASQIGALQEQVIEMRARGDLPGASAKLHEVLTLVGKRKLKSPSLRSTVEELRAAARDVDRLLVLKDLPKRLQHAQDLLTADKIVESRAAFQSILDATSSQGPNAPDISSVGDRAKEGLRQLDARLAAIEIEKKRQEATRAAAEQRKIQEAGIAKQREQEAARNAKIRATISGGAWSVKGGGASDLLRGMKVYLLKAECSGSPIRDYYRDAAEEARKSAARRRKQAQDYREKRDDHGIWREAAVENDTEADELEAYAKMVSAAGDKVPDRMDVRDAYRLMQTVHHSEPSSKKYAIFAPLGARFGSVVKEGLQKTVQVNVDGKFSLDGVPGGRSYLYAIWSTEFSSIEWLIPLDVKESGSISQDLFNDNAEIIWNKRT